MKKKTALLVLFALLLTLLSIVPTSSVFAEDEKHLRISSTGTPTGVFNPLLINDDYNDYINNLIYDSLTKLTPEGEVEPNLAESWELSDDEKTFTFHLNKDAKWHDGTPLTAEDVKFTYEFLAHKEYSGPKGSYAEPIKGFKEMKEGKADELSGIKVIDEHTIEITTEEVFAPFLGKCCFWISIIPKHIWEEVPMSEMDQQTELFHNPVGSGAFIFDEYVADQYTSVIRNDEYWGGKALLDRVTYVVVNSDTSIAQLLGNEIDVLHSWVDPEIEKMMEDAQMEKYMNKPNAYQDMIPNLDNPILQNKAVRQALATAINRQGIVESLLYGYGTVANQAYPTSFWAYPGDDVLKMYDYDAEEAKRLLTEEAGWEYKDGKMYADGEAVSFTISYPSGNKVRELSAPVIQENLQEIGIKVELQMVEFATLIDLVAQPGAEAFDFALMGHGISEDPDVSSLFDSDSGSNFMRWKNEEADELLKKGSAVVKQEERAAIYEEFAILVNEEMPTIFLYNWQAPTYFWPYVKGLVSHPFDSSYNCLNWDVQLED